MPRGAPRQTTVTGFWTDPHEVTNAQFAAFVKATGHVTVAEKPVNPASSGAGTERSTDQPDGKAANSWHGVLPVVNEAQDGFQGVAPAGCFAPNAAGLYDMVGNVWEVTADYFRPGHDPAARDNPRGPSENDAYDPANPVGPSRVVKGGSYLCAPNYCQRYRPDRAGAAIRGWAHPMPGSGWPMTPSPVRSRP